jgi:ABC-type uncharacterized transport system substrate-binding protein
MMRRREFITLIGGAAAAWPLAARAQQKALPAVGYLSAGSPDSAPNLVAAFRKGLSEMGYVEGQNVSIEFRSAEGQYDRLPSLATDLMRRGVSVIVTSGDPATLAAKAATAAIPIVFSSGTDPVKLGLVASLSRPGGNLTGASQFTTLLGAKWLELLHELVPTAAAIAFLVNPTNPNTEFQLPEMQVAASVLALQLPVFRAGTEREIDSAFETLFQQRAAALVVAADAFFMARRDHIIALAARHKVPVVYERREFTVAGGLMSYDTNVAELRRLVGTYTGRILKGEKPADLPVQQATKIELIINMKTAKALGLTFPITLLGRADEVIE